MTIVSSIYNEPPFICDCSVPISSRWRLTRGADGLYLLPYIRACFIKVSACVVGCCGVVVCCVVWWCELPILYCQISPWKSWCLPPYTTMYSACLGYGLDVIQRNTPHRTA